MRSLFSRGNKNKGGSGGGGSTDAAAASPSVHQGAAAPATSSNAAREREQVQETRDLLALRVEAAEFGFSQDQIDVALQSGHRSLQAIAEYIEVAGVRADGSVQRPSVSEALVPHRGSVAGNHRRPDASIEDEQLQRAIELSRSEYQRDHELRGGRATSATSAQTSAPETSGELGGLPDSELQRAIAASLEEQRRDQLRRATATWLTPEEENPEKRRRESPAEPVGLRNVGNTCYINSLLQVYFHLPGFRRKILAYRPETADDVTVAATSSGEQASARFVAELQRLFAFMCLTERKYVDPSRALHALAETLGATAFEIGTQQDASEFNDKFLQAVESAFGRSKEAGDLQRLFTHEFVQEISFDPQSANRDSGTSPTTTATTTAANPVPLTPNNSAAETMLRVLASPSVKQAHQSEASTNALIVDVASGASRHLYTGLDDYVLTTVDYWVDESSTANKDDNNNSAEAVDTTASATSVVPAKWRTRAVKAVLFRRFAPILTIYLQRVRFNKEAAAAEKVNHRFEFNDTIYVDRYLERNRARALQARQRCLQVRQRRLRAEQERDELAQFDTLQQPMEAVYDAVLQRLQRFAALHRSADAGDELHAGMHKVYRAERERLGELRAQIEACAREEENAYAALRHEAYRLYAVLVHDGAPSVGHYWAFIRAGREHQWVKFNDQNTSHVDEEQVVAESVGGARHVSAYGLIYIKADARLWSAAAMAPMSPEELQRLLPASLVEEVRADNAAFGDELGRWRMRPLIEERLPERLRYAGGSEAVPRSRSMDCLEWFCMRHGKATEAVALALSAVYAEAFEGASLWSELQRGREDDPQRPSRAQQFMQVAGERAAEPLAEQVRQVAALMCEKAPQLQQRVQVMEEAYAHAKRAMVLLGLMLQCLQRCDRYGAAAMLRELDTHEAAGVVYADLSPARQACAQQLLRSCVAEAPDLVHWMRRVGYGDGEGGEKEQEAEAGAPALPAVSESEVEEVMREHAGCGALSGWFRELYPRVLEECAAREMEVVGQA